MKEERIKSWRVWETIFDWRKLGDGYFTATIVTKCGFILVSLNAEYSVAVNFIYKKIWYQLFKKGKYTKLGAVRIAKRFARDVVAGKYKTPKGRCVR